MDTAAGRWREGLALWAIPEHILAAAPVSPYGFPVEVFAHAADHAADRDTPSRQRATEALPDGGTVLDVGCGAGAASLALGPRAGRIVGVDPSRGMLDAFAARAEAAGIEHEEIEGTWPDVASDTPHADVVVCHHVAYNVGKLGPFVAALDDHAHTRVVMELTGDHPQRWMNPLWLDLHGVERPTGPTADDAVAVLRELGIEPSVERWTGPLRLSGTEPEHFVASVRTRLCLSPDRDAEIAAAIERVGVPEHRPFVTVWWDLRTG